MSPPRTEATRQRRVELILERIEGLPTLSPIATRLLEVSSVEDADLDEIVQLIESDPAMTGRVLGLCRRADKGLGDRVTTVRRAVVMLGLEAVQSAVLSVAVYELMEQAGSSLDDPEEGDQPPARFDRVGYWTHAVSVACACELVASTDGHKRVKPETAFVAGLLHGVGKLVLNMVLPRAYARVIALAERRGTASAGVEREVLGLDGHTAGRRLAERWGLPSVLRDVIWLHAQTHASLPEGPARDLIGILQIARALCARLHLGWSGDFSPPPPLAPLCDTWSIDGQAVESLGKKLHEAVSQRCAVLGLTRETTPELLMSSLAAANNRLGRLNAMLHQRARHNRQLTRVLRAVQTLHEPAATGRPLQDSLAGVVRSAIELLGPGMYAVVSQAGPGADWIVHRFDGEGNGVGREVIESPTDDGAPVVLGSLVSGWGSTGLVLRPWLSEEALGAMDLRHTRAVQISPPGQSGAAVLLHDRDVAAQGLEPSLLEPLRCTWAASLAWAMERDEATRLAEQVVVANRELGELQSLLAEREAAARLGEIAGGAAHEMNTPLAVISARAQQLAASVTDETARASARTIADAAHQVSDLISGLELLARAPRPEIRACAVSGVLSAALERASTRTTGAERVRISDVAPDLRAWVDPEQMAVAVSELLANAVESGPGASVMVRVEARAGIEAPDGRLLIVVEDRGVGLSPRARRHAFDPFFSEKPAGRRTGLGLTTARQIVEAHGGAITLEPGAEGGTVATVALPWAAHGRPEEHEEARAA